LLPFLRHAAGCIGFWRRLPRLLMLLLRFGSGLDRSIGKERLLQLYLHGMPAADAEAEARSFVQDRLPGLLNPKAVARLRWHQAQAHRVLLVSASPDLYLQLWAAQEGLEAVLSTRLEIVEGRLTGRLAGPNCWGPEKLVRLVEHLGSLEDVELYAYGDTRGDAELLAAARYPGFRAFDGPGFRSLLPLRLLRALL
jgi:phosphatidylglycerophosphatase C